MSMLVLERHGLELTVRRSRPRCAFPHQSPSSLSRAPLVVSSIYPRAPAPPSPIHLPPRSTSTTLSLSVCVVYHYLQCTLCASPVVPSIYLVVLPPTLSVCILCHRHLLPCRPILHSLAYTYYHALDPSCPLPSRPLGPTTSCIQCTTVCFAAELQWCVQHNRQKCIRRRSQALGGLGLGRRGCYLGQQPIPVLTHPAYTHSACNMRHCLQAIFKPSRKQVNYDKRR